MAKNTCPIVEDGRLCGKPSDSYGLCKNHAKRKRKHGDPLIGGDKFTFNREAIDYFLLFAMTPTTGCRRWPFNYSLGYGRFSYQGERIRVHAAICELWRGPKPEWADDAAHSCGNSWCWAGEHLRWATRKGNMEDAVEHGTTTRGSKASSAKLTEADIPVIKQRLAAGETQQVVADDYGVGRRAIGRIGDGTRWAWLD